MQDAAHFVGDHAGLNQRVGNILAIYLQARNDIGQYAQPHCFLCGKTLAKNPGIHRLFAADHDRQEVG